MNTDVQETANAMPTKNFFVSMLTRDISLADAILDLVDNCLDGALRLAEGGEVDYSDHCVKIDITKDRFLIEDNCGGIPREVAKNYAFKMGREPDDNRDLENETIGMYGVGMKRAIFKMGREAKVNTLHGKEGFEVSITSDWLGNKNWAPLPITNINEAERLKEPGTVIDVGGLYQGVSRQFTNDAFLNELRTSIAEHFTMFLQKNLRILVNDIAIEPVFVEVLVDDSAYGPAPYIFQETIDDVIVAIAVGLNTNRVFAADEDDVPDFERNRSVATAGWTVFCNDRAVIVGDKNRLTGWGNGIPLFHYQFSIITGIVEFRSKYANKLPVTTTKRALDTSSDVWLKALVKMREGMRIWISYTNNWKNHPRNDQTLYWKKAKPLSLRKTIKLVSNRDGAKKSNGRIEYNPQKQKKNQTVFPVPPAKKPSSRRIVFSRPVEEIQTVSKALFDSSDEKPGIIGDECFELALNDALKEDEVGNE